MTALHLPPPRPAADRPAPPAAAVDALLARARDRIARWTPQEALFRLRAGAHLVDIRPHAQRVLEGEVPGSFVIERNVLEWRLDPTSEHRIKQARHHGAEFIVLCSEGYTSSLAAASLHDLGLVRSADVIGGIRNWIGQGLPTRRGGTPAGQRVPGRLRPPFGNG